MTRILAPVGCGCDSSPDNSQNENCSSQTDRNVQRENFISNALNNNHGCKLANSNRSLLNKAQWVEQFAKDSFSFQYRYVSLKRNTLRWSSMNGCFFDVRYDGRKFCRIYRLIHINAKNLDTVASTTTKVKVFTMSEKFTNCEYLLLPFSNGDPKNFFSQVVRAGITSAFC